MATGESENDAFFAQLLADLEHDEKDLSGPGPASSVHSNVPAEFTAEERSLRASLVAFYQLRSPSKLSSVNALVERYGRSPQEVAELWAQLAVKYQVPTEEAVDLLARTPHLSGEVGRLGLKELRLRRSEEEWLNEVKNGGLDLVRALCTWSDAQAAPQAAVRALCWKLLLGYLPCGGAAAAAEWPLVEDRKRKRYKEDLEEHLSADGFAATSDEDGLLRERLDAVREEVEEMLRKGGDASLQPSEK
ncbi:Hypothetical protein SCF082_LOCUS890 [Durusdinium trenchii]|uniref:Uncharacterized protein n=1 Tax=Durusdinium trenchii TaxID=1381693 RepID=A0ABP0HBJ9_9DINO